MSSAEVFISAFAESASKLSVYIVIEGAASPVQTAPAVISAASQLCVLGAPHRLNGGLRPFPPHPSRRL